MIRAYDPWPGDLHQLLEPQETHPQHENFPRLFHPPGSGGKTGPRCSPPGNQGLLIACGSGGLLVTDVQLEGSTRMNISQLIAGHPNLKDIHFDV